jgi:hypothetical protein
MTEFVLKSKTEAFLSTYQLYEDDEIQQIAAASLMYS